MKLFAIADLHLSLGTDKPMDVFDGWDNYTQRLKENWDKVVGENDCVVLAGDISWAMKLEDTVADFTFIHQRPGKKLIIKGNHDYWWSTKNKMDKFLAAQGFTDIEIIHNNAYIFHDLAICGTRGWFYNGTSDQDIKIINREVGRLKASISSAKSQGKKPYVFLHYPPIYDNIACDDFINVLIDENISDCYYGHIHGSHALRRAYHGSYKGINMNLISGDYLSFAPKFITESGNSD